MDLSYEKLLDISETYGDAFYFLDSETFTNNFLNLKNAFSDIYYNFNIAYSYKTNYIPKLCKIVDSCGGYAEVVSDMELEIALRIGVKPNKIIWNGPIKNYQKAEQFLISGGTINLDSAAEIDEVADIARMHPENTLNIGIRCNFDVGDGVVSRFGFDTKSNDFALALKFVKETPNIHLINLQCHFAKRNVEYWPARAKGMIDVVDRVSNVIGYVPDRIDIGGGIYGNMDDSLKKQFTGTIPGYKDYADAAASVFAEHFGDCGPEMLIEPGSAIAGDCMKFAGRVKSFKTVRGKTYITILGSQKNISMGNVNPPICVYSSGMKKSNVSDADIVGYTCIENDVMYRNFSGEISENDFIIFSNCGSYSVVMKPPFIMPNFPVLDICSGDVELIKRKECFDDLFRTYSF